MSASRPHEFGHFQLTAIVTQARVTVPALLRAQVSGALTDMAAVLLVVPSVPDVLSGLIDGTDRIGAGTGL